MKNTLLLTMLVALLGGVAIHADASPTPTALGTTQKVWDSVSGEQYGEPEDPAIIALRREELYYSLVRDYRALTSRETLQLALTAEDFAELAEAECETCGDQPGSSRREKVGLNKRVDRIYDFTTADVQSLSRNTSRPTALGVLRRLPDGSSLWTSAVKVDGATALRLHLTGFQLPEGAGLFIYNRLGEAFGPYTDRGPNKNGELWTNTIIGDELYLELRFAKGLDSRRIQDIELNLKQVAAMGDNFITLTGSAGDTRSLCAFNASCVEDASCYSDSDYERIDDLRKGIGQMVYSVGSSQFICSGGLLNDNDPNSFIPYFLTANHCFETQESADSLESTFRFMTESCGGACNDATFVGRTLGSSLQATNATSDYTLVRLSQSPPTGSFYLGWTSQPFANSNNALLYRISHPKGAPQAWSTHRVTTSSGTCPSWPRGEWIYSRDTLGATEGGSSGSPVLNESFQVVGQLTGGCGTNTGNVCDANNNSTVDGAFASYYDEVRPILNPDTTPTPTPTPTPTVTPSPTPSPTPPPGDDAYEENDTRSAAFDLSQQENIYLSDFMGFGLQFDEDWYEVEVSSGATRIFVECLFSHASGDIDLIVTDSAGIVVDSSSSFTDNETIDAEVSSPGTYYIRVYWSDEGNQYDLRWDDIGDPTPTPTPTPTPSPTPASGVVRAILGTALPDGKDLNTDGVVDAADVTTENN